MSHDTYRWSSLVTTLLLLTAAATPVVLANDSPLGPRETQVCFQVANEAGWALPGTKATIAAIGIAGFGHTREALSDANGDVLLDGAARDQSALHLDAPAPGPDGAVYSDSVDGAVSLGIGGSDDACTPGEHGHDLGSLVLEAPQQGFFAAAVNDSIRGDDRPLAGATIIMGLSADGTQAIRAGFTGSDGSVRLACPEGETIYIDVTLPGYIAQSHSETCDKDGDVVDFGLVRAPVSITGTVRNAANNLGLGGAALSTDAFPAALDADFCDLAVYTCTGTTATSGAGTLALPWLDGVDDELEFRLRAALATYSDAVESLTPVQGDEDGGRSVSFSMVPRTVDFTQIITDATGVGIAGVDVRLDGPTTRAGSTDGTGSVSFTDVAAGSYSISMSHADYELRDCTFDLDDVGGDGVIDASSLNGPNCFMLLRNGMGAAQGVITDDMLGGTIAGATVCSGSTCTTTAADGSYVLELPIGNHTLEGDHDNWTAAELADITISRDGFVTVDDTLERTLVDISVAATNATSGNGIAGGLFCALASGTNMSSACALTDASGAASFSLPWAQFDDGSHDAGDYTLSFGRTNISPFYTNDTTLGTVAERNPAAEDTVAIVLSLDAVAGILVTTALTDAHNSDGATNAIAGATVTATPLDTRPGIDECGGYVCSGISNAAGIASLDLPPNTPFRICVSTAAGFDLAASTDCDLPNDAANFSSPIGFSLLRERAEVTIEALDAHTGGPIQGANVAVTNVAGSTFVCDPDASFVCAGVTGDDGKATLSVPTTSPAEANFTMTGAALTVSLVSVENNEAGVRHDGVLDTATFLDAAVGAAVPSSADLDITLRALRAAQTVSGTTSAANGSALAATVAVSTDDNHAYDWDCDPAAHDSATDPDYDCSGLDTNATVGGFALVLPELPSDALWTVSASQSNHYGDQADVGDGASNVDLVLWSHTFDLSVNVKLTDDNGDPVACSADHADGMVARLQTEPGQLRPATSITSDGTNCTAIFDVLTWDRTVDGDNGDPFQLDIRLTGYLPHAENAEFGPVANTHDVTLATFGSMSAPTTNTVTGRVVDGDSAFGAGIAGADVSLVHESDSSCNAGVASGPNGVWSFATDCTGTFDIDVSVGAGAPFALYGSGSGDVTVVAGSNSAADIELGRATRDDVRPVALNVATMGAGVVGAAYTITGVDVDFTVSGATLATGQTEVHDLPWGTYEIAVTPPTDGQTWVPAGGTTIVFEVDPSGASPLSPVVPMIGFTSPA